MAKRIKYHTDDQGHYVWDNYFVGGKQRRSKRRVIVVDGKVVENTDKWLLANADDIFLHQSERWDLIQQRLHYGELDEFVHSLPDEPIRKQLATAIRGKGAFRRFKDIVMDGGNQEIKSQWSWFQTRRKRELIAEWLVDMNIAAEWTFDIFEAPPLPNKRADLLSAVLAFVSNARHLPGVLRIALIGDP
jgi:hypothetical protein